MKADSSASFSLLSAGDGFTVSFSTSAWAYNNNNLPEAVESEASATITDWLETAGSVRPGFMTITGFAGTSDGGYATGYFSFSLQDGIPFTCVNGSGSCGASEVVPSQSSWANPFSSAQRLAHSPTLTLLVLVTPMRVRGAGQRSSSSKLTARRPSRCSKRQSPAAWPLSLSRWCGY